MYTKYTDGTADAPFEDDRDMYEMQTVTTTTDPVTGNEIETIDINAEPTILIFKWAVLWLRVTQDYEVDAADNFSDASEAICGLVETRALEEACYQG
jgi:hypothetical protein